MAGSALLLDETFRTEDPRFLAELLVTVDDRLLKSWVARWWEDRRPFARRQLLAWIADGCDRPGQRVLVKGLYKRAEEAGDVELMAAFLLAFDRLCPGPRLPGAASGRRRLPRDRFQPPTRRYLRRRVWRWFRELGRRDPEAYLRAIRPALAAYQDEHLADVRRLLASWGLCHALWHHSEELVFRTVGADVAPGRSLSALAPAPYLPQVWTAEALLPLVDAASRTVRTWALACLRRDHPGAITGWRPEALERWLTSPHPEVLVFAGELLRTAAGLERLPVRDWLRWLAIGDPAVLGAVVAQFERHVAPERLSDGELVALAGSPTAPVAELAMRWLAGREPSSEVLVTLADAPVPSARRAAAERVLARVRAGQGEARLVRDLVDARHPEVRALALPALELERFAEDTASWAALAESPWPEVRAFLVERLRARGLDARFGPDTLHHLWATTLLSVVGGSRSRRQVLEQVASRLARSPEEAETWLPLLRVALRGVRPPERASALAAVVRLAHTGSLDRATLVRLVPELSFPEEAA